MGEIRTYCDADTRRAELTRHQRSHAERMSALARPKPGQLGVSSIDVELFPTAINSASAPAPLSEEQRKIMAVMGVSERDFTAQSASTANSNVVRFEPGKAAAPKEHELFPKFTDERTSLEQQQEVEQKARERLAAAEARNRERNRREAERVDGEVHRSGVPTDESEWSTFNDADLESMRAEIASVQAARANPYNGGARVGVVFCAAGEILTKAVYR